jgi:hypothetical protein
VPDSLDTQTGLRRPVPGYLTCEKALWCLESEWNQFSLRRLDLTPQQSVRGHQELLPLSRDPTVRSRSGLVLPPTAIGMQRNGEDHGGQDECVFVSLSMRSAPWVSTIDREIVKAPDFMLRSDHRIAQSSPRRAPVVAASSRSKPSPDPTLCLCDKTEDAIRFWGIQGRRPHAVRSS